MAAQYLKHQAPAAGLSHLAVDSAGTLGIQGAPASPEAVEAMREIGIDLSGHRSKGLEGHMLKTADLVVVMDRHHLEELAHRFPEGDDERLLIRAFEKGPRIDPDAADLEDPIGRPIALYRDQLELIRVCLDHLLLHLRHR